MNALIADDDEITRLMLASALMKLGYDVRGATSGREALETWHGGEFHLIISDWMMPDIDGLELCRHIRAEERADYTYIALITSRSGKPNYVEAMAAGADDFITKPFARNAFAARMCVAERVLGLRASLRDANSGLDARVCERTEARERVLRAAFDIIADLDPNAEHQHPLPHPQDTINPGGS